MNKPKITFGKIQLKASNPSSSETKDPDDSISGNYIETHKVSDI